MRTELKVFRIRNKLSQQEMAEKLGVTRACYSCIELGKSRGSITFWTKFQEVFNIDDSQMWEYQKKDQMWE